MKKTTNIIAVAFLMVMMFVSPKRTKRVAQPVKLSPIVIMGRKPISLSRGGLNVFLRRIARRESDNNQFAVNRFGFLGKYQFHPLTIRAVGVEATNEEFLQNSRLQDSVMVRYMRDNARELRDVIRKYSGKTIHGVYVTKSGILASAHLAGTTGVRAFFRTNTNLRDANGTSVAMYMRLFGGYEFSL